MQDRYVNRARWLPGPWDNEPDRAGPFDHHGLICFLRRHETGGYWNGYVGIPRSHPLHGWDEDDIQALPGRLLEDDRQITYAGRANRLWPKEVPRADSGRYFIGFSCGDAWDLTPHMYAGLVRYVSRLNATPPSADEPPQVFPFQEIRFRDCSIPYRTLEYAQRQVERLAEQLARIGR